MGGETTADGIRYKQSRQEQRKARQNGRSGGGLEEEGWWRRARKTSQSPKDTKNAPHIKTHKSSHCACRLVDRKTGALPLFPASPCLFPLVCPFILFASPNSRPVAMATEARDPSVPLQPLPRRRSSASGNCMQIGPERRPRAFYATRSLWRRRRRARPPLNC